ncbi:MULTISPECIES: SdpA family antimicrobial peptide system protein [Bacillales]|uniref:SdpA family antimicrobial peptide system protein n=1 Tax=Bacillales TaxID=1385 RepID=UPI0005D0EABE|nr:MULTISPECIES: SdpA family antimicrobial peptide system protein [Bacillaceae]
MVFFGVCISYFLLLGSSIVSALPTNPLSFTKDHQRFIHKILPQGWGFFSKDPRDPMLNAYPLESDGENLVWPNMHQKNWFGLRRTGRAQGIELGTLIAKIPESEYSQCNKDVKSCLDEIPVKFTIKNPTPNPTICGDWGITSEQPIPWAWAKAETKINMPSKVIRVSVICQK